MSEPPVTPNPTASLFNKYRNTTTSLETSPPTPDHGNSDGDNYDDDNDDEADVENEEEDNNYRDYHEEDLMVELLERRRALYARSNSLDPSRVRVSYAPSLFDDVDGSPTEDMEGLGVGMGTGMRSARSAGTALYRRRCRSSTKMAADERENHGNCDNIRQSPTIDIVTKLWSWIRGAFHGLRLRTNCNPPQQTTVTATSPLSHQARHCVDKFTAFVYNNKAAIFKWILIFLPMCMITVILPCLLRDVLSIRNASPSSSSVWQSDSALRLCNKFNLLWRTPVVVIVDTGAGVELRRPRETNGGRGVASGTRDEGSWRSSLRTRWTPPWSPPAIHSPSQFLPTQPPTQDKHDHQSLIKLAAPLSPTDGPTSSYNGNTDLMTECSSLAQRVTNLEQSLDNRNIDLRLMYTQLQSGRWIEDKILNVIRNWLPAELVLSKDPTTGKVQIPEAFWDGVKDVFVTRSHFSEVVQEELRRNVAEGKWEGFLAENENRIRCLNSDTNCKLSQRMATFARDEFLYLVATESNAIWTSLEGRVDSLVQRELAQSAEDKIDGGGGVGGVQGVVSRVEKEILTEIIDRAIEKYHSTHPRHGRHSHSAVSNNAQEQQQPDYALYNSGGRIIPGLTTQPYHRYKPTTLFGRFLGLQNWVPPPFKSDRLMAANKVIQPEMYPGDCWPMHEGRGQVAIDLAMRVVVTEVVIEHVNPMVSLHRGTAPREIEIWRLAAPTTSSSSSSSAPSMARDKAETPILGTWHKPGSPVPGASLLTTITYKQQQPQQQRTGDGKAETRMETGMVIETAQRFAIPLSKQNVPAYGVVVRVLSNWGHPDFACLYSVRVHGRPVQD